MRREIVKHQRVMLHLLEHYGRIAEDKIDPAIRFLQVAEEAFDRLAENPEIGRIWKGRDRRLAGIRVCPMPEHYRTYQIYYLVNADRVEILGVLHGKRDTPGIIRALGE